MTTKKQEAILKLHGFKLGILHDDDFWFKKEGAYNYLFVSNPENLAHSYKPSLQDLCALLNKYKEP